MPPIQAVLFDFGLVLTAPPDPASWALMQQITGLDEPIFSDAYWAHRLDYDRGDLSGRSFWRDLGRNSGIALNSSQIDDLIAADIILWTQPNPPMIEWVDRLQSAGTRTGILSNMGDEMARGICARLPWLARFDHKLWSNTLRIVKPEPEIYLHAAQGLATSPANILFVDDREENIAGALAVGMQAIRYATHEEFLAELERRGLADLWRTGKDSA